MDAKLMDNEIKMFDGSVDKLFASLPGRTARKTLCG